MNLAASLQDVHALLDGNDQVAVEVGRALFKLREVRATTGRSLLAKLMLAAIGLSGAFLSGAQNTQEPRRFFKEQIGLSDDQIATIDDGGVAVKALPSKTPAEVIVFGATYVNAAPEEYLEFAFDVDFGLKPTLRLNQVIAYRSTGPRGTVHVVAVKQLWASHYLQLALDLTACVPESGRANGAGSYVISLKGSTQQGLTGLVGSLRRKAVVRGTLSAQENDLINIKKALEGRK